MTAQAEDSNPPGEYYCPTCEQTFHLGDRCPTDGTRLVKLAIRIDPFLGRELDGRYTIIEKLGQGGMGAVYRSSQHSVGREVAIKVISSHLIADPDVIKRFLREAKLASRLSHPNAVAVLDFGQTDDGVFYLVMELVTGRTLDQVIKSEKTFKPERIVRIGTQVCDALEGAHGLSIVHRDLKPSNIMVLSPGRDLVKVLDFGLAKSVAPDQTSTTMTNAGALLGTPAFMPPELALGQSCDGRADLYSLGCVLYLLGSGHLPFQAESAHELIALHGTEKPPPMTGVPHALGRVIDRMLEKNPNDRYQSAVDNRDALEAALEGRLITPMPFETNPSIGPFPNPSLTSAPAKSPSAAASMERFVRSDTVAVADPMHPVARRRWLIPVIGIAGAAAVGTAVFIAINQRSTTPARLPPAPEPVKAEPAISAPAPTPDPAAIPAPIPPATPPVATPPAVAPVVVKHPKPRSSVAKPPIEKTKPQVVPVPVEKPLEPPPPDKYKPPF